MGRSFFQNTCKPEGFGGKMMVAMMNNGHASMAKWGFSHIQIKVGNQILDIGCGGGVNVALMLKENLNGKVTGIDYSEVSVEKSVKVNKKTIAEGKCEIRQGNAASLDFVENSFDLVTAFETIYFWPDLVKCFKEVHRVLKSEGKFMICNESCGTNASDEKWTSMIEGMTIYKPAEIKAYLEQVGFTQIEVDTNSKGWVTVVACKK